MSRHAWFRAIAALTIAFAASVTALAAEQSSNEDSPLPPVGRFPCGLRRSFVTAPDEPETVLITLRAKAGGEEALARVIARHWETARELRLVRADAPHMTLKGTDGEQTQFVEIMTWRDAGVPDAAPPAIQAIWKEMSALVEARGGRPGLEIVQMTMVAGTR
jgi:hypothetical protein